MRTRRQFVIIVGMLLVGAVALGTLIAPSRIQQTFVPLATVPVVEPDADCTGDCAVFIDELRPPLQTLVAEGAALARLGQTRSRNVLELTVRMDRFRSAAANVRAVIANGAVPEPLQADVGALSGLITSAELAIDDSIAAIRSLDWEDLGRSVDHFAGTIDQIRATAAQLSI